MNTIDTKVMEQVVEALKLQAAEGAPTRFYDQYGSEIAPGHPMWETARALVASASTAEVQR